MRKLTSLILIIITVVSNTEASDCFDSIRKINKHKSNKVVTKGNPESDRYNINVDVDNSSSSNNYGNSKEIVCPNKLSEKDENAFGWNELFNNVITIILGLIAGFVALYQMKSNIISSARIRWIEDLRDSLSKCCSASLDSVNSFENFIEAKKLKDQSEDKHYKEYDDHMTKFNTLKNRIKMLLNSNEKEHRNIEIILNRIDTKLSNLDNIIINQDEIEDDLKEIMISSKIIFRKEWKKSKKLFEI